MYLMRHDANQSSVKSDYMKKDGQPKDRTGHGALHHYVPRFYLSYFGNRGKVSVWLKQTNAVRENQNPAKVARARQFYSFTDDRGDVFTRIEEIMADLEGNTREVVESLNSNKAWAPPGHREVLANFVALQHTRLPRQRKIIEKTVDLLTKLQLRLLMTTDEFTNKMASADKKEREIFDELKNSKVEDYKFVGTPTKGSAIKIAMESAVPIYEAIKERPWLLVKFKEPCLITSDDPVILLPRKNKSPLEGVGFKTAEEIWFPLTAKMLLVMGPESPNDWNESIPILDESQDDNHHPYKSQAEEHNRRQIVGCYMEAYGRTDLLRRFGVPDLKVHTGVEVHTGFDKELAKYYNTPPKDPRPRSK